jgi:hypothetical protein
MKKRIVINKIRDRRQILKACVHQLYLFFFVFLITLEAHGKDLDHREFYISKSILLNEDSPKLNFEKDSNLKWFEDSASLISSGRTELGVKNIVPSYTLSYRNQNLHGIHNGRGAKFECFLGFCAWVDTSIISGLDKSERIDYKINMQQIWIEKIFGNSNSSIGLITGINVIAIDLNISSTLKNYHRSETVPVPFLGVSSKYQLRDKLYVAINMHHFEAQKNNVRFAFHDSEIELIFDITKYLRASIGNNIVYLNLSKYSKDLNAEINVPQSRPYLKFTLNY